MKRKFAGLCCIKEGDSLTRHGSCIEIRKGTLTSFDYREKMLRSCTDNEKRMISEISLNNYIFKNCLNGVI